MNEAQFEKLFKNNFESLTNVAYAVVKDKDQAKDIVQQVFVKFWDKRNTVDIEDNIRSYLKRATINTALNYIEREKKIRFEEDLQTFNIFDESDVNREKNIIEMEQAVRKAVARLPEKCQVVFSLSRYEGMTNQEIADYLEVSIKAVEKHISRALKDLRTDLKPFLKLLTFLVLLQVGFSTLCLFLV